MSFPASAHPLPSTPISERELASAFASTDADTFWDLYDVDIVDAQWANDDVRNRFYAALKAAGCGKRLVDGVAHFTFIDGSAIRASRCGITR